jgi:DNA primase/predicted transcriptional regulator
MDLKDIKQQLTINQVLQHYGLKPDKNNRLLCPFHPDKTPSLQIYPATNTYCCFSSNCNAGTGDAIQFIQLKENCNKHEALVKAASLLNSNAITTAQPAAKLFIETEPMERIAVLTKAFKSFSKALPMTKKAVEYMQSRSLDYKLHEVGFISDRYHHELSKEYIAACAKVGLLKPLPAKGYSVWAKDCIIFPLKNTDNKIISLYGRSITNNDDSRHFYLSNREGLYPGYPALTTKKLILTESIIDAASLLQQKAITSPEPGEGYSILSLYGTNGLTDEHIKAITELPQLEEIILMLNADEPGEAATHKHAHTLLALHTHLRITHISLPAGEDVNSLLQSHDDPKILLDLIEQRESFSTQNEAEGSIEKEKPETITLPASQPITKLDVTNAELLIYDNCQLRIEVWGGIKITGLDRMKVTLKVQHKAKQLLPIRDTLDLYSRQQTENLIQTISENFDANIKQTETTISELTNELENYRIKKIEALQPKQETKNELTAAARQTAVSELKKEKLLERHNKMIGLTGIVGEEKNRMIAYLIYGYRKNGNPLHVMFLGASGSGKTYLQEKISELIPEEDKMEITQITENALYYFKQEELKNKLIIFEDLDGALQVFYPMRELQTKKKISKTVTLKDSKGNLKTITIVVEGPVCISGCTTKEKLYEDNANRCILLYIDMSKDQDKKIMEYHAAVESGDVDQEREQQYKELFKNIQRVLRPIQVNNPYSKFITLPEAVFKPRRTITLLRGFIKAIAFYHQYQREVKKDKHGQLYIDVTIEDIEAGFYYMKDVLFSKSDELTKATREFLEQLKQLSKQSGSDTFNAKTIREQLRMNPGNMKRYLSELVRYGYIKANGNRYRKGSYEYSIVKMDEYEALKSAIEQHLQSILQTIREHIAKQGQ